MFLETFYERLMIYQFGTATVQYTYEYILSCVLQVGKNNVNTALSLVGYENELDAAMKFVFGDSFVCPSMDCAKKVTYDQGIMKKSVTFDGDSFNPGGTLTGGKIQQKLQ